MCGIAGYLGKKSIDRAAIIKTQNSLNHRGPDGKGIYKTEGIKNLKCLLLHSRLSIIDNSELSAQPMHVGDFVLVFNGEIYNYLEVRRDLINLGHQFETKGDTEVLAHALLEWGIDALDKLEGMWSFAWYNKKTQHMLLCRDRFGEKPLYYTIQDDGIYFASETRTLAELTGLNFSKNKEQITRFLVNGYRSIYKQKALFYEGINEVESSMVLMIDGNLKIEKRNYWRFSAIESASTTYQESVSLAAEALERATLLRLRSDVPIAFCMSGGIDSNALIGIANKQSSVDVHGFSIICDDHRYDETKEIEASLRHLGIRHTSVKPNKKNFLSNLIDLVKEHDAPLFTISYYLHSQLLKSISDSGYKVAISGTGADEIFSGYYDHYLYYLRDLKSNKTTFESTLKQWKEHIKSGIRNPLLTNLQSINYSDSPREHLYPNSQRYSSFTCANWSESFMEENYCISELRNRMLNEMFHEVIPIILHEDDLNSMRVSVENRSPFLDRNLFEVIYSLPVEHLMKNCWSKSLLRDASKPYVAPEILNKRLKVGFNAALEELFDVHNQESIEYLMSESPIYDLIDRKCVEELAYSKQPWSNETSKFLFSFINCKIFMDQDNNTP